MNHYYKTGQLASCDGYYIHEGNKVAEFNYIEKAGTHYFPIPEQMADLIGTFIALKNKRTMNEDRLYLKAGTPEKSKKGFLGHSQEGIVIDQITSNPFWPELVCQDGGKIVEKAKAWGNAQDIGYNEIPLVKPQTQECEQNSIVLFRTYSSKKIRTDACYAKDRYYSTYRKDTSSKEWDAN